MKKSSLHKICVYAAVLLMLVSFVLLCSPFWSVDGQGVSIASYINLPNNHPEMQSYMEAALGSEYKIHSIFAGPLLQEILTVVGIVLIIAVTIMNRIHWMSAVLTGVYGILGVWSFLTKPAFQLGASWTLQLAINIVILALSVAALVISFVSGTSSKDQ